MINSARGSGCAMRSRRDPTQPALFDYHQPPVPHPQRQPAQAGEARWSATTNPHAIKCDECMRLYAEGHPNPPLARLARYRRATVDQDGQRTDLMLCQDHGQWWAEHDGRKLPTRRRSRTRGAGRRG